MLEDLYLVLLRKMNKILSVLFLILAAFDVFAQSYKFISSEDGLSNSLINKIIQDQNGFVWIATEDGLNCYDGNRVKVYRHIDKDSNSLANNFIRDIFIDSRGRMFVGTYKGIQMYDPLADNFSKPARSGDGDVFIYSVMSFVELSDNTIIALGDSPCTVDTDRRGDLIVKPYILPQRTSVHPVDYMVEAPNGSLFVADNRGGLIRTDQNSVHNYSSDVLSGTLFKNNQGEVFACSNNNDMLKYNAETDSFECVVRGRADMPYYMCKWLGDDKVLACTDGGGLKTIDLQAKTISHYSMAVPFLDDTKLKIHSVFLDNVGNIWLGLYQKGVLVLSPEKSFFNYIGHRSATDDIIGQNCVSALCFCNGYLWVATDNDGIYVTDLASRRVAHHLVGDGFPNLIMTLFSYDERYVYVGSYGSGLWKVDAKTFEYKRVPLSDDVNRLHFSRVSHIRQLDNHILVFSSLGSGVGFVDTRTDKQLFFKNVSSNANLWASCVEKIAENSFAVGSYNGVYFIENYNGKAVFRHIFERIIIFSLLSLDDNRLAAATSEGLYIIKNTSDGWGYSNELVEGTSSYFYSLTKDSANNIWAGSDNGLYRIAEDNGKFRITHFSTNDGTVNNEFAKNAVCKSADGMVYFGGFDGITFFKPKDMRKFSATDKGVRITRFWLRDHDVKAVDPYLKEPVITEPASRAKEFVLPHDQNSFTIVFAPVDFFSSPTTRYYYSVNDEPPVHISNNMRQLSFIRLSPDVYNISIFGVTDGVESPKYTVTVTIKPAWYASSVALIIYVLLLLALLAFLFYRFYRKGKNVLQNESGFDDGSANNTSNANNQSVMGDTPQKRPDGKAPFARKRIFLIDDDTNEAAFIMSELRDEYLVTHFNNGAAAITDILNYMPDIVITDLMAPELDGFSLCKRIKQNININGIPVVIITDKTGDDVEISSLQAGADAFISKPFNIELLKQTVKNLISLRHKLIVNYSGAQQPKEATDLDQYEDPEEKLIKRIVKAVEKNISNAEYSTEMLAADVGLSRVHLYRKLKDLTNQTGSEFIRNIRLKRASELILNRKGFSIAEVADMVGFPNTAYFCTAFRNFFGTNPTAWREQHSSSQDEDETTENS